MKNRVKKLLLQKGWYHAVRWSWLFSIYSALFKPSEKKAQQKEVDFYTSFLKNVRLIFDIGANDGHKTAAFLQLAQKVVAVEPDKNNIEILQARFKRLAQRVVVEKAAVSNKKGYQPFYVAAPGSAFNTLNKKFQSIAQVQSKSRFGENIKYTSSTEVDTTTLDALIEKHGLPHFIKVDTEGAEREVMMGLSHPIPFISLEFMLPEFYAELQETINLLEARWPQALQYNIAVAEKLVFTAFTTRKTIEQYLHEDSRLVIELIVANQSAAVG